jgi:hypothetical protein
MLRVAPEVMLPDWTLVQQPSPAVDSLTKTGLHLQAFSLGGRERRAARLLLGGIRLSPIKTTQNPICRDFQRTGATGLEPATSGVTGHFSHRYMGDDWP